ncbi:hypothetical protein WA026_003954 [Henosepilachna vigintioctopunctata]|uniref:LAGLIDADG homing endonuclease n=1 Tax=Henosepilachna vigintioctopunctata TaxID=420089 RepID=A0AAW1UED8_9CUCU
MKTPTGLNYTIELANMNEGSVFTKTTKPKPYYIPRKFDFTDQKYLISCYTGSEKHANGNQSKSPAGSDSDGEKRGGRRHIANGTEKAGKAVFDKLGIALITHSGIRETSARIRIRFPSFKYQLQLQLLIYITLSNGP